MSAPEQTNDLPTHVLGVCDECRSARWFPSEHDRDLWLKYHPHESSDTDG